MDGAAGWSERLYERVHRRRIERLRRGELDGAGFEQAQRAWARNLVLLLFAVFTLVAAGMDWGTSTRPRAEQVERTLYLVGIVVVMGVVIAIRVSRFARFGARNFLIRRMRQVAESNPALDLTSGPAAGTKPIVSVADGTHRLSASHGNRVLMLAAVASLAFGGVMTARPALLWIAPILAVVVGRAIFMRFDRRPFVEISPEGIWCRGWGPQRHPWHTFKAIYPRQNRLQRGVAFVPHSVPEFSRTLSWLARYSLRSGDGIPAHVGSVTLWATQVGLNRDALMRALQARIVSAQDPGPPKS